MKKNLSVLLMFFSISILHAKGFNLPVTYDTLKNGLRIIILPDTNVAVVSCRLYYFVGSMYEGPGTTGLSHMFEHMMFKGTKRLGTTNYRAEIPIMKKIDSLESCMSQIRQKEQTSQKDSLKNALHKQIMALLEKQRKYIKKEELWEFYQNNGGTRLNAWTADDMTGYIVTLPKNKVELFYWIESDRMSSPVLREFYSELNVVTEERRMRYENRPLGKYIEQLNAHFYIAHPFRIPTIGWMSDINAYTRKKMARHVKRFYTPDNALIVLVGNINPKQALKDINRYFGSIPRATIPKQEVVTREPQPAGQTRFIVRDEANPRLDMLFHTPGYPDSVLYKLDVVESIFSGKSGRLYRRLVDKEGLCTNTGAANYIRLHNGEFLIWAELKQHTKPERVEAIIIEELDKIKKTPPTSTELMRISNNIKMSFISGLKSLEGISDRLAWFERLHSWKDLLIYPEKVAAVKAEAIPAIAKKYLNVEYATIGILQPPKKTMQPKSQNKKKSTTKKKGTYTKKKGTHTKKKGDTTK